MLFPGLAIFITVLAFNLFGDGLRDALDPTVPVNHRDPHVTADHREGAHPHMKNTRDDGGRGRGRAWPWA